MDRKSDARPVLFGTRALAQVCENAEEFESKRPSYLSRTASMTCRPGNNPKRRIAPSERLTKEQKDALKDRVRYVGSGHHKRNPADYGLPRANPRPTKSLCDLERTILLDEARQLVARGIEHGLFSEPQGDGFPKFIWSVSEHGEVFPSVRPNDPDSLGQP